MTHVITKQCESTCDTACVSVCPVDVIHGPVNVDELRALEGADRATAAAGLQLFIDPDGCINCGCCVPECPVDAIYPEDEVPAAYESDIEANARYFSG